MGFTRGDCGHMIPGETHRNMIIFETVDVWKQSGTGRGLYTGYCGQVTAGTGCEEVGSTGDWEHVIPITGSGVSLETVDLWPQISVWGSDITGDCGLATLGARSGREWIEDCGSVTPQEQALKGGETLECLVMWLHNNFSPPWLMEKWNCSQMSLSSEIVKHRFLVIVLPLKLVFASLMEFHFMDGRWGSDKNTMKLFLCLPPYYLSLCPINETCLSKY